MQKQHCVEKEHVMHDEDILVVNREVIFQRDCAWSGLKRVHMDWYLSTIEQRGEFQPRSLMECDARYKQIIPYIVFMHDDHVFVMQRKNTASEKRLASKLTVGIGGHIRKEDLVSSTIFGWATREFHEEVAYNDAFTVEPLGIVNDDSNSVGEVHLGFVFLVRGTTPHIAIRSELKSGVLVPLASIKDAALYETWSQVVLRELL
jgi:predicted NUDIX family phosphoesterase